MDTNKTRIDFLKQNKDNIIIDCDTHISDMTNLHPGLKKEMELNPNYFHGRPINMEDILKEMKISGVNMCLIWQNPSATYYPGNQDENFESLLAANKYILEAAEKHPEKFIPAGWTDPRRLGFDNAVKLLKICVKEFKFPIVKINPAQNKFPIDSNEVLDLTRVIIETGALPAFHFGADTEFTPPEGLQKLAQTYPDFPVIAVHMGGGGAGYVEAEKYYNKAREIGLKYSNIKYILSAKRDTHIESDLITYQLAGEPYSKNIFCASDVPYGRQSWNFGGFKQMFCSLMDGANHTDKRLQENPKLFDKNAVQNYMGRSFAELVLGAYKNIGVS